MASLFHQKQHECFILETPNAVADLGDARNTPPAKISSFPCSFQGNLLEVDLPARKSWTRHWNFFSFSFYRLYLFSHNKQTTLRNNSRTLQGFISLDLLILHRTGSALSTTGRQHRNLYLLPWQLTISCLCFSLYMDNLSDKRNKTQKKYLLVRVFCRRRISWNSPNLRSKEGWFTLRKDECEIDALRFQDDFAFFFRCERTTKISSFPKFKNTDTRRQTHQLGYHPNVCPPPPPHRIISMNYFSSQKYAKQESPPT